MTTIYRPGKLEGLNQSISGVGNLFLQKMLQDQEEKKKLRQTVEASILEAALKKQQLRPGTDLSQLDTSNGIQGVLGQIPKLFQPEPLSYTDQRNRDFMLSAGAISPTTEELTPYEDVTKKIATKLGANKAIPYAGDPGSFVIPTPGQPNEFDENIPGQVPTQDITNQIKGIQPEELFTGQLKKRMGAYNKMSGRTGNTAAITALANKLSDNTPRAKNETYEQFYAKNLAKAKAMLGVENSIETTELIKPDYVDQADWDAATEEQKREFLGV